MEVQRGEGREEEGEEETGEGEGREGEGQKEEVDFSRDFSHFGFEGLLCVHTASQHPWDFTLQHQHTWHQGWIYCVQHVRDDWFPTVMVCGSAFYTSRVTWKLILKCTGPDFVALSFPVLLCF